MANFNRPFGTPLKKTDKNVTENTRREEAKTGREVGSGVGDTASMPAPQKVEHSTGAKGKNSDVWEQARLQVKDTFGGLDETAQNDAIQARYDSMLESDKQVKKWAGDDSAILGNVK
jgi:hypothetical protein